MGQWTALVSFLVLLCSCGPNASSVDGGGGSDGGVNVDARDRVDAGACEDSIDVVFVLDVSSSMKFVLDDLEDNIDLVVDAAAELAEDPHFGLIPYVDNFHIDDTGALEDGLVHTDASSLTTAFAYYRQNYTQPNRNPGDGLTGPTQQNPICEENALDALYAAAESFPWRERASRVIIVATDDTFIEAPDNYGDGNDDGDTNDLGEGDYPALRTLAETKTALIDRKTRVFSFSRSNPPGLLDFSRCGTGRRYPWASISAGWSTPIGSEAPIPEDTDGRNFDIDQVKNGQLSLAATINEVVLESHCEIID